MSEANDKLANNWEPVTDDMLLKTMKSFCASGCGRPPVYRCEGQLWYCETHARAFGAFVEASKCRNPKWCGLEFNVHDPRPRHGLETFVRTNEVDGVDRAFCINPQCIDAAKLRRAEHAKQPAEAQPEMYTGEILPGMRFRWPACGRLRAGTGTVDGFEPEYVVLDVVKIGLTWFRRNARPVESAPVACTQDGRGRPCSHGVCAALRRSESAPVAIPIVADYSLSPDTWTIVKDAERACRESNYGARCSTACYRANRHVEPEVAKAREWKSPRDLGGFYKGHAKRHDEWPRINDVPDVRARGLVERNNKHLIPRWRR